MRFLKPDIHNYGNYHSLALKVYGIIISVFSDDTQILEFIESNYFYFKCEQVKSPNINVWISVEHGIFAKEKKNSLLRFGEGLYLDEKTLYWENEFGFAVLINIHKSDCWELNGYHFNLLNRQSHEERLKDYTRCMRWMVHYPIFLMLNYFQRKQLVHATAVCRDKKAIVFAGLNKVGKSSLGYYLHKYFGFKFLSDNFVLTDGKLVYAFPEKSRLSFEALEKLKVESYPEQTIYKKYHLPIDIKKMEYQADPEYVFIVNNHHKDAIIPMERVKALKLIETLHRYLQEFPEFTFYSLIDSFDYWERTSTPLFPTHTRFYNLSISLDWKIEDTANEVMECISTT